MSCLPRIAAVIAAVLLLAAPAAAQGLAGDWRHPRESRHTLMLADLAPVNVRLREADSAIGQAVGELQRAAGMLDTDELARLAAVLDAGYAEAQDAAADGLAVLDRWPPEACDADFWAVQRTAYLLLGDAMAGLMAGLYVGPTWGAGRFLAGEYADLTESITECPA